MNINRYIDHTILSPLTTSEDIIKLCGEAKINEFYSVCINPSYIPLAKKIVESSDIKICTVIGFPLGQMSTASKVFEAKDAILNGADEIDMVINIGKVKDEDFNYIINEIKEVRKATLDKVLKVIVESSLLSKNEIIKLCEIIRDTGVDFIKTSTGFNGKGAQISDVKLMKSILGNDVKIKASGGIKTYKDAKAFIDAGANRIGTSSGVNIVFGERNMS